MKNLFTLSVLILFTLALILGVETSRSSAQEIPEPPFRLPFQDPPGPDTWLMGQAYGNTAGAYRQRASTYAAGQGLHFGVIFLPVVVIRSWPLAMASSPRWMPLSTDRHRTT